MKIRRRKPATFGNPVCGVRSHENTPAHEVKKWTNVGEFVHPFATFDGQNEYCYVVDFVQESISPLSWYLGVAPEKRQPFGNVSRMYLGKLVHLRTVTVETNKRDRYQRELGKVIYEPDWRSGKAVSTRISRADGAPMGIAGIWGAWRSPTGETVHSFTMLTINADDHPVMRQFHKPDDEKRMVVILNDQDYDAWLTASVNESRHFLKQYPAENLLAVSKASGSLF
ncbi:MAG: SOS response-associated peptidase family protein [Nitrosomonas ureae]